MIVLLLGSDQIAKETYVKSELGDSGESQTFTSENIPERISDLFAAQLFGAPAPIVFNNCLAKLDSEEIITLSEENPSIKVYLLEDKLDKRTKANQELIKDKRVSVIQMDAPLGTRAAIDWINNFAKTNNFKIDTAASNVLAHLLVPDDESTLNVLRAQSELLKLKSYADGDAVTPEMVGLLVESEAMVDVFALLNAIATKNKKLAVQMMETFFATETADEKTNAIKVAALLADQFRSLLIALDADERRMPDEAVLKLTGWKQGRLFVMKKLSRNFTTPKVRQAISKLDNLDRELKTGSMPPQVVLDLIIADM